MRNRKNPHIAILGISGMLGSTVASYLYRKGYKIRALSRKDFNIVNDPMTKLKAKLSGVGVVINCAGVIKPRVEKSRVEDVLKVNALFPRNLALMCKKNHKLCIHITTDCVFSGNRGKYIENDYLDPTDLYGISKSLGDNDNCMTLRTSIIGEEINNKYSLLEWAMKQKGTEVSGFSNHKWNGVTTLYLSEIIEKILKRNLYKQGIYHIHSREMVTKYQLLKLISDVYDLELEVKKVTAPIKVDRTLSSIYKLSKTLVNKPLKDQLTELKYFFAKVK